VRKILQSVAPSRFDIKINCRNLLAPRSEPLEQRYNLAALRFQAEAQAKQFPSAVLLCGNAASILTQAKSRIMRGNK
jgi:hypothetical protein